MDRNYIKNLTDLNRSKERSDVLDIINAGINAIDTRTCIREKFYVDGDTLHADGHVFDLKNFERIAVFAFGKASVDSVKILEEILGDRITKGVALDKRTYRGNKVEVFEGSHPHPSMSNVTISTRIAEEAEDLGENDLAIVVVSGGGSALLCYPELECDQGNALYDSFLKSGGSIRELNTIRKHISSIKGGGLAKFLYPATVVSLVLCDVSGEYFEEVASGPTYKDNTTVEDAKRLLEKFNIKDEFVFNDTPKEDKYFEKVVNVPVVSNVKAINAMKKKAEELGYVALDAGCELYESPDVVINKMNSMLKEKTVVIGGGEPSIKVEGKGGSGGRNEYTTLCAINLIDDESVFSSVASDGIDNHSKYAGAVVDKETKNIIKEKNINLEEALKNFDPENLFFQTNDLIDTGETGANVSDLFLLLKK